MYMGMLFKILLYGFVIYYVLKHVFGFKVVRMNDEEYNNKNQRHSNSSKRSKENGRINTENIEEIDYEEIDD